MSTITRYPLIEILLRVRYNEVSAYSGLVICPEVSANRGLMEVAVNRGFFIGVRYKEVSVNRGLVICPL